MALIWAAPPTRDTDWTPTLIAGRTLELNRSALEEDLAVGDRDDVGRDVGRDVTRLGLDDRQAGHGARAEVVGELGAALEEPAVQVEDVTRVGLAARRAAQQQRHGAVGLGLLGQVVEHDEDVLALVHPVLADGRAGVRGEVLEARGVRGRRGDDGGVLHGARLLERAADGGDRGCPSGRWRRRCSAPASSGRRCLPELLLVDDRVDRDRGLAGLAVADDELALATADRRHGVDGLDAGLQRLVHRLALHDVGRLELERPALLAGDLAEAVDRRTERVDDAAEERVADGHGEHLAGPLDLLALLDRGELTEDDDADLVDVEVERQAQRAVLELEELVGHRRGQALDVRDAVAGVGHATDLFARGCAGLVGPDVAVQGVPDLVRTDRELRHVLIFSSVTGPWWGRSLWSVVRCPCGVSDAVRGLRCQPPVTWRRASSRRRRTVPSTTVVADLDPDAAHDGGVEGRPGGLTALP
jgi:hypothetical protein